MGGWLYTASHWFSSTRLGRRVFSLSASAFCQHWNGKELTTSNLWQSRGVGEA